MNLNDDRIDDYILGRLDENGKKTFVEEMDKDEYLRADTTLTADIADALGRREEKVMKMKKLSGLMLHRMSLFLNITFVFSSKKQRKKSIWTVLKK